MQELIFRFLIGGTLVFGVCPRRRYSPSQELRWALWRCSFDCARYALIDDLHKRQELRFY